MMLALGRHLADSTVFALVVGLVCFFVRGRGPAARHTLWLIAAAKFVVPTTLFIWLGQSFRALLPAPQLSVVPAVVSRWVIPSPISGPPKVAPVSWFEPLVILWAIGSAVAFVLWLCNLRAGHVSSKSLDDSEPEWFARLSERMGLQGRVWLTVSDTAREPALAGFWRPVVMIPASLAGQLSPAELESVTLHELAHAKRRDNWTAAFAHVVTCVFWFYPLLWWIEKRLHVERELACDEIVIRCGATADDYFAGILKVCRFHLAREIAGVAGISGSSLKERKEAIMSVFPDTPPRRLPKTLIASLIAAVLGIPLVIGLLGASNAHAANQGAAGEANTAQETVFTMARQPAAPARFIEATFGVKSLLVGAKLKNVGSRPITQYRIGWVVVYPDGKTDTSSGQAMNVPAEIGPGAVEQVPDQGVSPKLLDKGPREILFFLDEARFSTGDSWVADARSISTEATGADSRPTGTDLKTQNAITCASASVEYPEGTVIQIGDGPEQMCVRTLGQYDDHRTGSLVSRGLWVRTSEAIRKRTATVVHVPAPPPVFCSPGPAAEHGICTCQAEGQFSPGAQVNSAVGPLQLRCENGNWVQTKQPNVKRP